MAGVAIFGTLLLAGCGRSDEKPKEAAPDPVKPSAIAEPPAEVTSPSPAGVPEAIDSPTEAAAAPAATPPKVVYVVTAFEAVSDLGTHEFPVGAKVNVMEVEGEDYLVEYNGVAVKNGREFFSETLVVSETAPVPTPSPSVPSTIDPVADAVAPSESGLPDTTSSPDPALVKEEQKSAELLGEIRTINDEIRKAEDAQTMTSSTDEEQKDSSEIKRLKKRRDSLSEDLTEFAKP